MASKGILDRHRIAKTIVAAARTHAREVGERLQEVLASAVAEGETLPDFVTFQHQLARYREARIATIVEADKLQLDELDDDLEPRLRRDQAAEAVYDTLVAIRETLTGPFGAERAAKLLGIDGRTSTDPLTLFHQATLALERLTEDSLVLPPARLQGVQLDLGALAAQLQPALDELGQAVQEVDEEQREGETTIREKDLALDAFDVAVRSVGRIVKAFDELAGFPEFSARIRLTLPARRRQGTTPTEPPPEPSPDGPSGEETPLPDGGEESPPESDGAPSSNLSATVAEELEA